MICPKCGQKDIALFNEPEEVRVKRFPPLSIVLMVLGFLVAIFGIVVLVITEEERFFDIAGWTTLGGFLLGFSALMNGAKARYKTIYRVKGVCRHCGFQYLLEQPNIPRVTIDSRSVSRRPNVTETNSDIDLRGRF